MAAGIAVAAAKAVAALVSWILNDPTHLPCKICVNKCQHVTGCYNEKDCPKSVQNQESGTSSSKSGDAVRQHRLTQLQHSAWQLLHGEIVLSDSL